MERGMEGLDGERRLRSIKIEESNRLDITKP